MDVCVCVCVCVYARRFFSVVLSCVDRDLASARSPVQEVLPNVQNRFINFRS
jgi:hypothetical protein